MKRKLLSAALAVLMVVMLCVPALAAGPTLTYDLTSGGENAVTVPAGSDVTVTFTIKASSDYSLNSIQNVITYDESFLTLKSKSASVGDVAEGQTLSSKTVKFSDMVRTYTATQVVGTMVFTVKSGATGSTTLRSTETIANDSTGNAMSITTKDLTITVGSVTPPAVPVTGVALSPKTLTLTTGGSQTLTATVAPANASDKNVTWTSSAPSVATVSDGVVTAVAPGSAIITVTTADGGKADTCLVTVNSPVVAVTGVTLNKAEMGLVVNGSEGLIATVAPENATNKNVSWTSSAPSVATVSNGVVTAKAVGDATITVTTADGSKTATCTVHVSAQPVPAQSVSLNKDSTSLPVGSSEALIATVTPANATSATLTWSSSNASVAAVSASGTVTAVSEGTATITVRTANDKTDTCTVTVTKATGGGAGGGGGGGGAPAASPTVTAFSDNGGTITPSGVQTVKSGESITFKIKANDGCTIKAVFVDGKDIGAVSEYTFKNVKEAHTIYASFYNPNGGSYKNCKADSSCPMFPYSDLNMREWYHDGVHYCIEKGLMKGISSAVFQPNGTTTRAQIVTILWRMEGSPMVNYAMSFKDVPEKEWFADAIRWAQSTGVVTGYDDDYFGPNDNITREQMAAIMYRYAKYKGIDVSARADLSKFSDQNVIGPWALENVQWANAVGLVNGRTVTTVVPLGNATRAESATIIMRFCENVINK